MISLHDFLPCFSVMTLYQSQTIFMFSRHVSYHVFLHVSFSVSLYVFRNDLLSNNLHVFSSWFSIKVKRSSCFLIMFLVMILYQTIFMFSRHNFLSNELHVSLYDFLSNNLHVFLYNFLSNNLHVSLHDSLSKDNAKR